MAGKLDYFYGFDRIINGNMAMSSWIPKATNRT